VHAGEPERAGGELIVERRRRLLRDLRVRTRPDCLGWRAAPGGKRDARVHVNLRFSSPRDRRIGAGDEVRRADEADEWDRYELAFEVTKYGLGGDRDAAQPAERRSSG
jgi:hypothetical protein